jgi:hypothetical protein
VKRWAWCHNECGRLSKRQFFEAFGLVDFDAASRSEVAELLERNVVGEVNGPRQGPAGVPFPISSAVLAWWHPVSRAYLQSRRVSRTQALKHFLTYVPTCARHKGDYDLTCVSCYCRERIVVPILRVGFIARDVTRQAFLKGKTLPGSNHKRIEATLSRHHLRVLFTCPPRRRSSVRPRAVMWSWNGPKPSLIPHTYARRRATPA